MKKEAQKGICMKCKIFFYLHKHHILPQAIFGKDGETIDLCPNCHTHFHEYSNLHTVDPKDQEEAQRIWEYWFKYVPVIVTILVLVILGLLYFIDFKDFSRFLSSTP